MKAVELRSLNLLEGGLGIGKAARGVPMAAAKGFGACAPLGATILAPVPNSIPAAPPQLVPVPAPQQQQQPVAIVAAQQGAQPALPPAAHQAALPLKSRSHPAVAVSASGVPLAVGPPTVVVPMTGPAAAPAPHIGMQAPALAPGVALVPPPSMTGP